MAGLVEIFNDALIQVGGNIIGDPDEQTPNAIICAARWNGVRRAVLRAHPSNCSVTRASLPAESAAPAWGYGYSYLRSTDPWDLRTLGLEDTLAAWKVEGRRILTDAPPPLNVRFVWDNTDTETWDPLLIQAAGHRLAYAIAYKITRSRTKEADMLEAYGAFMQQHRSIDAQEGSPDPIEVDELLSARI